MILSDFKKLIELSVENSKKIDTALEIGVDLIEYTETHNQIINLLLSQILTVQGLDWYNWFMYEKGVINDGVGREDMKAYSTEGEEEMEIASSVDSLFDYLKTNKYFKCDQK
jgi:hypothetical protein